MDLTTIILHALSTFGFEKVFHAVWEKLKPEEREAVRQLIKAEATGKNSVAIGNAAAGGDGSVAIGATDASGNVNLTQPINIQTGGTSVHIGGVETTIANAQVAIAASRHMRSLPDADVQLRDAVQAYLMTLDEPSAPAEDAAELKKINQLTGHISLIASAVGKAVMRLNAQLVQDDDLLKTRSTREQRTYKELAVRALGGAVSGATSTQIVL